MTAAESRALDAALQEELAIPSLLLMENAGRGAAEAIEQRYGARTRATSAAPPRAALFAGSGNNGGDGFVVARHLLRLGWRVDVAACGAIEHATADATVQRTIVEGLTKQLGRDSLSIEPIHDAAAARRAAAAVPQDAVIIDALVGTGFRGPLREPLATLIAALNEAPRRATVALDLPSGLDADTGTATTPTFRADLTLTFAAMKRGLATQSARAWCGEVVVIDLGVPEAVLAALLGRGR